MFRRRREISDEEIDHILDRSSALSTINGITPEIYEFLVFLMSNARYSDQEYSIIADAAYDYAIDLEAKYTILREMKLDGDQPEEVE